MLKATRLPRKRGVYAGLSIPVEDTFYAVTFAAEMQDIPIHRMGFAELTIHGEPSPSEITRTGSVIVPIIVFTNEPVTAQQTYGKAATLRQALQGEADLKKPNRRRF